MDYELLAFGKHKGKTFQWVVDQDAAYCEWFAKLDTPTGRHGSAPTQRPTSAAFRNTSSRSSLATFRSQLRRWRLHLHEATGQRSLKWESLSFCAMTRTSASSAFRKHGLSRLASIVASCHGNFGQPCHRSNGVTSFQQRPTTG